MIMNIRIMDLHCAIVQISTDWKIYSIEESRMMPLPGLQI